MNYIPFSPPPSKKPLPSINTAATSPPPPQLLPLTTPQISAAMSLCLNLQTTSVTLHSKRPFFALLLGPDNTTPLLTQASISHVQHAECELARLATLHFSQDYLSACTLVSTWEPCAMCSGTLYWAGIGRLLYAASEKELAKLTGSGNGENLTMNLPCRTVLEAGQRQVEIVGPLGLDRGDWEGKVIKACEPWWREHNSNALKEGNEEVGKEGKRGSNEQGGVSDPSGNGGRESVYSQSYGMIDEDGEYEAELDIDWLR